MKRLVLLLVLFTTVFCCGMQEKKKLLFTVTNLKDGKRDIKITGHFPDGVGKYTGGPHKAFNVDHLLKSKECQELLKQTKEEKDAALKKALQFSSLNKDWVEKRGKITQALVAGANPKIINDSHVLCSAIIYDDPWLMVLLLMFGADPNKKWMDLPIVNAKTVEEAELLYACGAKLEGETEWENPVDKVLRDNEIGATILQFYLDKGARWKSENPFEELVSGFNYTSWRAPDKSNVYKKLKLLVGAFSQDKYEETIKDLKLCKKFDFTKKEEKEFCDICIKALKNPKIVDDLIKEVGKS